MPLFDNAVNITSIAITGIKNVSYRSIIRNINKSEATNLLENSVLEISSLLKRSFLKLFCFSKSQVKNLLMFAILLEFKYEVFFFYFL